MSVVNNSILCQIEQPYSYIAFYTKGNITALNYAEGASCFVGERNTDLERLGWVSLAGVRLGDWND